MLAPATIEDAREMLSTVLELADPVLIFGKVMLYDVAGKLRLMLARLTIDKAAVRRARRDLTLITYGGSLSKTSTRFGARRRRHRSAGDSCPHPAAA